ncbi:hypothetical protein TNCV_3381851 [Trichonephila clavipes]|nr:hypothetical protein TNCV_3381851 [Trichonephila clavipes]
MLEQLRAIARTWRVDAFNAASREIIHEPRNLKSTHVLTFVRCRLFASQPKYLLENPIPWKRGVWGVSITNAMLSREEMVISIYSPLQSECGGKSISSAGIAVIAFSSYSGSERVKRHRLLPMKVYTFTESFA